MTGYHNSNYIVPLGWRLALLLRTMPYRARVKCRTPLQAAEVAPRIWPNESELLTVVTRHLREVPRCLRDFGDWSMHAYRAGRPLTDVDESELHTDELMARLAEFFARTAAVPESELPPRPEGWPASGDSDGFLAWLIDFTEERVHRANRQRFDALFEGVGIRRHAMTEFKERAPRLHERPFCLLHTDVHRANIVVDRKEIAVIDWELALYGDPLHDLATHLVRMDYDKEQHLRMRRRWVEAMTAAGRPELTAGLDEDLPVYLDFEYAQSVFPDVMRAAIALPAQAPSDADFAWAAARVCRALRRAAEPLRLEGVPDQAHAVEAVRSWHAEARGREAARPSPVV
ncbi:aminoglycoside phosphotransferase family protein [Streptomyces flavofungini]|uniref:aminoglycoside phosphotransferase family protein n=1 Tax=Streptomyces flavofungini TaxID=68200 RepID=UPI0025B0F614|nr:aminoglycoside phosphotransferase family protein [Streptomyces flavofungini]WJV47848.1 aminoglycoside phosphotransferase family protein [Streptomyces flavofungini]